MVAEGAALVSTKLPPVWPLRFTCRVSVVPASAVALAVSVVFRPIPPVLLRVVIGLLYPNRMVFATEFTSPTVAALVAAKPRFKPAIMLTKAVRLTVAMLLRVGLIATSLTIVAFSTLPVLPFRTSPLCSVLSWPPWEFWDAGALKVALIGAMPAAGSVSILVVSVLIRGRR